MQRKITKLGLAVALLVGSGAALARSSERWIDLGGGLEWDVFTARNVKPSVYSVFYVSKTIDAAKEYLRSTGAFTNSYINRITYGRTGVYINCKSRTFGIFSSTNLDANHQIMGPTSYADSETFQWQPVEPETVMESLSISVCSHFEGR